MASNVNLNVFNNQTLFEDEVAFQWKADTTLLDLIPFPDKYAKMLEPTNHAGDTVMVRRPSWVQSTIVASNGVVGTDNTGNQTGDAYDESLANAAYTPAEGFQPLQQVKIPVTVTHEIRADIEVSAQRLTQSLTRKQIQEEFLEPLFTQARENMQVAMSADLFNSAGNAIQMATGGNGYAANLGVALGQAGALMQQRIGTTAGNKKYAVFHPDVFPSWFGGAATNYNIGVNPREQQAMGGFEKDIAGFLPRVSAILSPFTIPAPLATATTATVAAPAGSVTNGLSTYSSTWSVNVAGFPNNTLYPAGTKFTFTLTGGAGTVNWNRPTTNADLGKAATFTLTAPVTTSGTGTATFVLAGPLIFAGGNKNVNITTALPTGTYVNVFTPIAVGGAATLVKPIIAFDPKGIVGVSPLWDIPIGTPYSKRFRSKTGFNFTLMIDRWPGTGQTVMSLRGLFGTAQIREESFCTIYGA
jgi:hypothetical protein